MKRIAAVRAVADQEVIPLVSRRPAALPAAQHMTKAIVIIAAGIFLAGSGLWRSYCDDRELTSASETQAARLLARDPALKLVSEDSPYMRTER